MVMVMVMVIFFFPAYFILIVLTSKNMKYQWLSSNLDDILMQSFSDILKMVTRTILRLKLSQESYYPHYDTIRGIIKQND